MTNLISKFSNKITLSKRNSISKTKKASPITKKESTLRGTKKNQTLGLIPMSDISLK